jgi:hypothetical protein
MQAMKECQCTNGKIRSYKIVMLIIRYERVVSRLPLFVEQNINAKAPLKFKRRLEVKISKIQASKLYHN